MPHTPPLIAYYRVSSDRQERSGLGLDAQRETVRRYAKGTGRKIVSEYQDALSGQSRHRPQLAAALAEARYRKCPIIVAKLDRLARDAAFLLEVADCGVPVVFCDLPELATGDPIVGRLILTIMAAIAEFEARRIGQRIKEAWAAKQKRMGGKARTGVQLPKVRKAVDRANADRPQKAASLAAPMLKRKLKLHEIAATLSLKGHRTAQGKPWTGANLWRVIGAAVKG